MARTRQSKGSSEAEGVISSAVEAAKELGAAAMSLKRSWDHVQGAKQRGRKAQTTVRRAVKGTSRAVVRASKKVLPHRRGRRR